MAVSMTMTAITRSTSSSVNPRRVMAVCPAESPRTRRVRGLWRSVPSGRLLPVADLDAVGRDGVHVRLQAVVVLALRVVLVRLAPRVHQGVRLDERLAAVGRLDKLLEALGQLAELDFIRLGSLGQGDAVG